MHLPEPAGAVRKRHRRRGADPGLLGRRRQAVRDQRHGLLAGGAHHRLLPGARHRPDSGRRFPAGMRAGHRRHVGVRGGALRAPALRGHPGTRHRAGRGGFSGLSGVQPQHGGQGEAVPGTVSLHGCHLLPGRAHPADGRAVPQPRLRGHAAHDGRGGGGVRGRAGARHRGGARRLLPGTDRRAHRPLRRRAAARRHRRGARRPVDHGRHGRMGGKGGDAVQRRLPRRRGPQVRAVDAGAGIPAAAPPARRLRSAGPRAQLGRLPAHRRRVRQARLRRPRGVLR